jgi:hypothetical protein
VISCVLSQIVQDDGPTAGPSELRDLAVAHDLMIATVAEIVRYRARHTDTAVVSRCCGCGRQLDLAPARVASVGVAS